MPRGRRVTGSSTHTQTNSLRFSGTSASEAEAEAALRVIRDANRALDVGKAMWRPSPPQEAEEDESEAADADEDEDEDGDDDNLETSHGGNASGAGTESADDDSINGTVVPNSHHDFEYSDAEQDADNESTLVQSAPTPTRGPTPPTPTASRTPIPGPQPPQRFICHYCPRVYNRNAPLDQHIRDRHCGTRCYFPGCGRSFSTEDGLLGHFRDHQRQGAAQSLLQTQCPWPGCGKVCSRRDSVQRCIKRHNRSVPRGA
ncbi:hypothetical protein GGR55DRAFT_619222 [Xylaria sp. FL0064]|nr:hypothetical protein GGR55DRAFT_619222 [Xylaria sp. FL0064]